MSQSSFSPLFKHAMESFDHALDHYLVGKPRDRKFALLHLDHAIELILKEKISRIGKDLYKADGQTISFHEALKSLKNLNIPEKTKIQEIHDMRNIIQHKGLNIDEVATRYYVLEGYAFIKRFLVKEFELDLGDILAVNKVSIFEGVKPKLRIQIENILSKEKDPLSMVINSYSMLENYIKSTVVPGKGFRASIRLLSGDVEPSKEDLKNIMKYRSMLLHQNKDLTEEQIEEYRDSMRHILNAIQR